MEQRNELKCEICGSKRNLVCHHDSYKPEIVRVLCPSCHIKLHLSNPNIPKRPKNFSSKISLSPPKNLETLKITPETHEALTKIKGKLMAEKGREVTYDETIAYLTKTLEYSK
jgi:hypothetical protein